MVLNPAKSTNRIPFEATFRSDRRHCGQAYVERRFCRLFLETLLLDGASRSAVRTHLLSLDPFFIGGP